MTELKHWVVGVLGTVLRLALWGVALVLALFLLALALALLLLGALWALLRGRKPAAPVIVGQFQRYATGKVWRGAMGRSTGMGGLWPQSASTHDVVDVQVREVAPSTDAGQSSAPSVELSPKNSSDRT